MIQAVDTPPIKNGHPKINFFNKLQRETDTPPKKNGHQADRATDTTNNNKTRTENVLVGFDEFWQHFPRKIAKQSALKSWQKLAPTPSLQSTIMKAVDRHKTTEQWQRDGGKFIPHPATWLNGSRWEDEIDQRAETPPGADLHEQAAKEVARSYGLAT